MALELLSSLLREAGEDPLAGEAEIVGEDPIFPLSLRIGEAGAAAIAACGVAASRLWQLRTGRLQHVSVDVDAAAAAMRGDRYLQREIPSTEAEPSPRAVRGTRGDIYLRSEERRVGK